MKILSLLLTGLLISISARADVLGDSDDTYIGLQVTIPLDTRSAGLFSQSNQFSLLLIEQDDGFKDGIVMTMDNEGLENFSYIAASPDFAIGSSRISDYATPLFQRNRQGRLSTAQTSYSGLEFGILLIAGSVFIIDKLFDVFDDIDEYDDDKHESEDDS
jgi:hypothetical protein